MINPAVLAQLPGQTGAGQQPNNTPAGATAPAGRAAAPAPTSTASSTSSRRPSRPQPGTRSADRARSPSSQTNLSLVVSQTQEVHEEIVDLLEQLRRMQDLQVTIEVRFITLSDNFFERIGVDFDFNIAQNIANPHGRRLHGPDHDQRAAPAYATRHYAVNNGTADRRPAEPTAGNPARRGIFTSDLDIPFYARQLCPGGAAIRRFRRRGGRHDGLRHPQRHRGLLLHQRRPGRHAHATSSRPPRSRSSTASRPSSPTPRRRRS